MVRAKVATPLQDGWGFHGYTSYDGRYGYSMVHRVIVRCISTVLELHVLDHCYVTDSKYGYATVQSAQDQHLLNFGNCVRGLTHRGWTRERQDDDFKSKGAVNSDGTGQRQVRKRTTGGKLS
jgi:hypothetical protein